jgi:hypothetical protein
VNGTAAELRFSQSRKITTESREPIVFFDWFSIRYAAYRMLNQSYCKPSYFQDHFLQTTPLPKPGGKLRLKENLVLRLNYHKHILLFWFTRRIKLMNISNDYQFMFQVRTQNILAIWFIPDIFNMNNLFDNQLKPEISKKSKVCFRKFLLPSEYLRRFLFFTE